MSWAPHAKLTSVSSVGIIGAGPAGLFAANVLVRAGIDCELFERLDEDAVRARARAGLIEDRTARLLVGGHEKLPIGGHQSAR